MKKNRSGGIGTRAVSGRWSYIAVVVLFFAVALGCAERKIIVSKSLKGPAPKRSVDQVRSVRRINYSIQLGAFRNMDNAVRLARSLTRQGLDAYYFKHSSGLYKVRFGNFFSKESAIRKAENLRSDGIVEEYYIVGPENFAAARKGGPANVHLRDELVKAAEGYIGLPYRWGGSSPAEGFDCSGLTMTVYQVNGLELPHSSKKQFKIGRPVGLKQLQKGDLVFFDTRGGGKVSHVGIYVGKGRFIHAPGEGEEIRKDLLSNKYFKTRYLGARSYL